MTVHELVEKHERGQLLSRDEQAQLVRHAHLMIATLMMLQQEPLGIRARTSVATTLGVVNAEG